MEKLLLHSVAYLLFAFTGLAGPLHADELLNGVGATFPIPFYNKLIEEYQKQFKTRIDYQGVGSGEGVKALLDKKVDFGASDIFLSDKDLKQVQVAIVHIPTCIGAVAIIYNLPGKPQLKLNAELLADMMMGGITRWSDSRIGAINDFQTVKMAVTVVHRADSSGTNFLLTDYLTKASAQWEKTIGRGNIVSWPVGMGVTGNAGVAEMVSKISGSIGYVSLSYAEQMGLEVAAMKNRAGHFIKPTQESASLAADIDLPKDCRALITDTPSEKGYPISGFSYILVYKNQAYDHRTRQHFEALVHFLGWIVGDGQQYAKPLYFAPLPAQAVQRATNTIRTISFSDAP
jgi:phosphate transport system substrate-binding protein